MTSINVTDDPLYLNLSVALDKVCDRIEETVHKQREQLEARRKKHELASAVAAQRHLQSELSSRLAGEAARADDLVRVTADLRDRLAVTSTDSARLHSARELYQLGKELTGVRWDFAAPPHLVTGYVKSSSRKLLEWFSVPAGDPGALWTRAAMRPAGDHHH